MIMLRGRNFKENIKMFGKVEKYRLKMVGPLMYLSLCEGIMIMLRGRNFKEKIKMFRKIEKYRFKNGWTADVSKSV